MLLHQQELKLGWGKAVAMPSTPLFAGTATAHAPVKGERLRCLTVNARKPHDSMWLVLYQVCTAYSRQHFVTCAFSTAQLTVGRAGSRYVTCAWWPQRG